jgi:hypothetical protein
MRPIAHPPRSPSAFHPAFIEASCAIPAVCFAGLLAISIPWFASASDNDPSANPGSSVPQFRATPSPAPAQTPATISSPSVSRAAFLRISQCPDSDLAPLADFVRNNHPTSFDALSTDRETVGRMLRDLGESVQILEPAEIREEQESPFHADLPEERVGYLRLGCMTSDHVSELETALGGMLERKISALVLDLRATGPSAPPEALAQLCRLFCPKGKVLFRLKKPRLQEDSIYTARQEPVYRGPLAVLVGPETEGAAEAAASVLRREGRALLVGSKVPGTRLAFAETVLSGGLTVRVAVGALEPSGPAQEPSPDLVVPGSVSDTRALLALGLQHSTAAMIGEPERPRLNEAALVAGLNPELDSGRTAAKKGGSALPVDAALQTAVDLCSTIRAFDAPLPVRKPERPRSR